MTEPDLLSRIEDAGINASAPPQQRWLDGWILRTSPGKARRSRCVNAVAVGRLPLDRKLALAARVFDEAGLPFVVRITPFTQPAEFDAELDRRGYVKAGETKVLVIEELRIATQPLPRGCQWHSLDAGSFAEAVGQLRGSPAEQRRAHAERLSLSAVPYRGHAVTRGGQVLACGGYVREADIVGIYDVCTREGERRQGLATVLCARLLALASGEGARVAYLQVEVENHAARRIYERLGFVGRYAYHYRSRPAD